MGLFVRINLDKRCPNCGAEVGWETKHLVIDDVYPIENSLQIYELNQRMDADAYTYCDVCNYWTDVVIKKGRVVKEKTKELKSRL